MLDTTDLSEEKKNLYQRRAETVVNKLRKKNINAECVLTRQDALDHVLEMIPKGSSVGRGDSVTLDQVEVFPELRKRNQNKIIDPYVKGADGFLYRREQRRKLMKEAMTADVFLTGTNAVTLDGKLVNVDGLGNRVSAMVFGPEKVIAVVSANKIVKDVEQALDRIRNFCAPMNAQRHYLKHHITEYGDLPCVKAGRCVECNHDFRIDHYTLIIDGSMIFNKDRINVVLVVEELGI